MILTASRQGLALPSVHFHECCGVLLLQQFLPGAHPMWNSVVNVDKIPVGALAEYPWLLLLL